MRGQTRDGRAINPAVWLILLHVIHLAWLGVIWLWEPSYLTLTVDDSFYYLKTAVNIAAGRGVTFDGVNPTNGFHPLWMAVLVPLARLFGDDMPTFTRVVLSVQLLLLYAGGLVLWRSALPGGRQAPRVVALLLTNFYFAKVFVNGQESALLYVVACGAMAYWWRRHDSPAASPRYGQAVTLGLLCGLLVLTRLDALVLPLALILTPPGDGRRGAMGAYVREAVSALATMGLVLSPYVAWNVIAFGHVAPVNAVIKAERIGAAGLWPRIAWVAAGAVLVLLLLNRFRRRLDRVQDRAQARALVPVVWYAAVATAYVIGGYPRIGFPIWYFVPQALLVVIGLSVALSREEWERRRLWAAPAVLAYGLLTVGAWAVRLDPASYAGYAALRDMGWWIRDNTAEDALVAGWDCGIAAAHSGRRFMGLDGLASSWEYKEQYLDTGRVEDFVTEVHVVDYIVQHAGVGRLERGPKLGRLDAGAWYVVRARTVRTRSIIRPLRSRSATYLVLSRQEEGISLGDFARQLRERQTPG